MFHAVTLRRGLEGRTGQILIDPSRQLLQLLKDPDPQIRKQVLIYLPGAVNKGRFPGAEAVATLWLQGLQENPPAAFNAQMETL